MKKDAKNKPVEPKVKWTRFKALPKEVGGPEHAMEAVAVPGVVGEGSTPAEARLAGLEFVGEVLGERAQTRGELLARYLKLAWEEGIIKHEAGCVPHKCAPKCLIGQTHEAVRGDPNLKLPKPSAASVKAA